MRMGMRIVTNRDSRYMLYHTMQNYTVMDVTERRKQVEVSIREQRKPRRQRHRQQQPSGRFQ